MVSDHEAAAFTLATLTAWRMIHSRARVTADDHVLIWGIGGGVAQAALQICRNIGATVWVTSSDPAKLERAKAMGARVPCQQLGDAGVGAVDVEKDNRAGFEAQAGDDGHGVDGPRTHAVG